MGTKKGDIALKPEPLNLRYINTIARHIRRHDKSIRFVLNTLCAFLLLASILYTSRIWTLNRSINADTLIFPYFFQGFRTHDIVVATHHANLFKFPLFILQAILPYNLVMFYAVTVGLNILTVTGWTALCVWTFGKRYFALSCTVISFMILVSPALVADITGTTFRNIEFVLGFAFVLVIGKLVGSGLQERRQLYPGLLVSILFGAAIAGDSFLMYCFILPTIATLFLLVIERPQKRGQTFYGFAFVALAIVVSELYHAAINITGIASYYLDSNYTAHTVGLNRLSASITTASRQLLDLFGGNIFGLESVSITKLIIFAGFGLLVLTIVVYWRVIRRFVRRPVLLDSPVNFVMFVFGISFFLNFLLYILTGQVNSGNHRYISLMPLLGTVALIYLAKSFQVRRSAHSALIPAIMIILIVISVPYIRAHQHLNTTADINTQTTILSAVSAAEKNNVKILLTGYWYEASTRFWSHGSVMSASIGECTHILPPVNSRLSWYTRSTKPLTSGLLIDRSGRDKSFWSPCTEEMLRKIYGKPTNVIYLTGVNRARNFSLTPRTLQLWVYDYDVRSKLNTAALEASLN